MEAASTSETSINFYQITWRNIPKDSHLRNVHSSTNPLVCSSGTSEKSRPTSDKCFYFSVSILSCSLLFICPQMSNSKSVTGVDIRAFVTTMTDVRMQEKDCTQMQFACCFYSSPWKRPVVSSRKTARAAGSSDQPRHCAGQL
jgi:hypothetical protein